MTDELPTHIPKSELTEQDLRDFYVQKNLLHGYQQMVAKYSPASGSGGASSDDGFITHVIADTGIPI